MSIQRTRFHFDTLPDLRFSISLTGPTFDTSFTEKLIAISEHEPLDEYVFITDKGILNLSDPLLVSHKVSIIDKKLKRVIQVGKSEDEYLDSLIDEYSEIAVICKSINPEYTGRRWRSSSKIS